MAGVNELVGTPWHVERYCRKEGDGKRHQSRCIHYGGKQNPICSLYGGKCHGTAHCKYYEEPEHKIEQSDSRVNTSTEATNRFEGIRYIPIDQVIVDQSIAKKPTHKKITTLIDYYNAHGELDKPIVVECQNNSYILTDKYLRFYVAKKLGLSEIPAEMGSKEEIKQRDAIRKVGALVWNKKKSVVGEIIEVKISKITVKYDSGKIEKYDIHKALSSGYIRPL